MNFKKIAKEMLKYYNINLPVKYSTDFYLSYNEDNEIDCFYVPSPKWVMDREQIIMEIANRKYTEELLKKYKLSVDYKLFTLYHEIGHIFMGIKDFKEYETELNLLEMLFRENKIDENQYISLYNMMKDEENANIWAICEIQSVKREKRIAERKRLK